MVGEGGATRRSRRSGVRDCGAPHLSISLPFPSLSLAAEESRSRSRSLSIYLFPSLTHSFTHSRFLHDSLLSSCAGTHERERAGTPTKRQSQAGRHTSTHERTRAHTHSAAVVSILTHRGPRPTERERETGRDLDLPPNLRLPSIPPPNIYAIFTAGAGEATPPASPRAPPSAAAPPAAAAGSTPAPPPPATPYSEFDPPSPAWWWWCVCG